MGRPVRSESEARFREIRIENRDQDLGDRLLDQPIQHGWYSQWAIITCRFGNLHTPNQRRLIRTCKDFFPDTRPMKGLPDRPPQIRIVIFRNTSTAFTPSLRRDRRLSRIQGFDILCCLTRRLGLGSLCPRKRVLFLFVGSLLCTPASFRQNLTVLLLRQAQDRLLFSANTCAYIVIDRIHV